jgi:iron complex outermembrane receptor protein
LGAVTGAVNFVTKPADGRTEREVLLATDRWATRNVGLGIGGKASEGLAYRADVNYIGAHKGSSGYVDRSSYEYYHASGELALQATDRFKVTLSGEYVKDQGEWYFGTPHVGGSIDERVRYNNYNVDDDRKANEITWARLNLEYLLAPQLKLRNETYFNDELRFWRNAEVYIYNARTGRVDRSDFLPITHDQRLVGNRTELQLDQVLGGMRNRAIVGIDYSRNDHQRDNNSPFSSPRNAVDLLDPVPGVFVTNSPFRPQRRTELIQKAVFAEDLLDITKELTLSLSARRDWVDLDSFDLRANSSFDKAWSGNSWRAGVLYDVLPSVTLYGQFGQALEPPSQIVTLTPAQRDFDLTRACQVEVGVKASLPRDLGEATVALFDIERTDVLTRDPLNPSLTVQIGEQSARGVEVALVLRPAPRWTLEINGSVLDAKFDNFNENVGGVAVSRTGNLPPDVPEELANLWATYRLNDDWRAGGGAHYVGKRTANNANTVFMDAYTTVDAWVAYRLKPGDLRLAVRNLTDEVYANRSYGTNGSQFILGEPRAIELSYSARF